METPNASLQLLPEAEAERRLEAVSCKALFGNALLARGLGDCRVWIWNGVELIVPQPFDPC